MILSSQFKQAEKLAIDNSPTILTAVGVAGAIASAVLTGKASFKAAALLGDEPPDLPVRERVALVWKLYIPAVGVGSVTVVSIIGANRVGMRRAAAIAAAYTVSEKAFVEYKDKVLERMGANDERKVRDEIAQDRVKKNPPVDKEVVITGNGDVLFVDKWTGRYFNSQMETVKKAQNDTNYEILHNYYCSLTDFYDRIGLSGTPFSDEVGWTSDHLMEIIFSTVLTDDGRPCISMDFHVKPIRNFDQLS